MSQLTHPSSPSAVEALDQLTLLQGRFREGIDRLSALYGDGATLAKTTWLRDQGVHGGGWRFEGTDQGILNRGSLNISTVHYDDLPEKRLSSATALSCIVHPDHPQAPSLHTHISWTELRDGSGGWRLMADLNPSIPVEEDRHHFVSRLDEALLSGGELSEREVEYMRAQGDQYFQIPSLHRTRGVAHYYLEQWRGSSWTNELATVQLFGVKVIDTYLGLVDKALRRATSPSDEQRAQQLDYHSTYFLQVLTLDRGTSSGLMVHDQNDVGILGSLPQRVSPLRLRQWSADLPSIQRQLMSELLEVLPDEEIALLSSDIRAQLAQTTRRFLRIHPEAISLQARGDILPPTVAHHQDSQTH